MNSQKCLYLAYASSWPSQAKGQTQEDFLHVIRAIKRKRNDNFLLLVLVTEEMLNYNEYEFDTLLEGNLIFHKIKLFAYEDWHISESHEQWFEILNLILFPQ